MIYSGTKDKEKGFTLIELIAVMVLVGILAAVAGMGIVQAAKAFVFTKNTTEMGQKNVLPMTRLRRSLANLTLVTAADANSITLNRLNNGNTISETYAWSGTSGDSLTVSIDNGIPRALVDDVRGFALDYQTQNGGAGSWSVGDLVSTLAYVTVDLTLAGGDGTQTLQFSERVVPRNTYIPSEAAPGTAQGTTSADFHCFIKSRLFKKENSRLVDLYREARTAMLRAGAMGEKAVGFYNNLSPGLCRAADTVPGLMPLLKLVFLPITGLLFFIFHTPWIFLIMGLASWFIFRMVRQNTGHFKPLKILKNAGGSILIGVIITMVVMAALTAAMVGMFSSSNMGSVTPQFSQQAYYMAESGLAYAAQRFLRNENNNSAFINSLNLGGSFPVDNNSFALDFEGFWFDNSTSATSGRITVSPIGSFPGSAAPGLSGYLQIPVSGSSAVVPYSNTSLSGANLSFIFSGGNQTYASGDVFPACLAISQTVTASELGADPDLTNDVITATNSAHLALFPDVNGIISFTDPAGNDHIMVYRRKTGASLTGLQYPKGVAFSGITINSATPVVLGKHAVITSTGTAGTGSLQSTQTIRLHQPLSSVELFKKIQGGIGFDPGDAGKIESKLGTHAIDDGTLKVTSTDQTYSYTNYTSDGDTGPVLHNESLAVVNWDNDYFETDFLKTIWEKSDHKLSYDLQAKVKFTEAEDDTTNQPVNHPGSYMPGLSFRVRSPKSGSFGQATYYGLSFLRGIKGVEQHEESSGSGCNNSTTYWYTENDDITDNFFNNHGSNAVADDPDTCPGSSYNPSNWNDDPPLDGIPYIMLWQKDVSTDAAGNPVNTGGCGGGADYSPWEWLAYTPLVEVERVKIYYYHNSWHDISLFYEGPLTGDHGMGGIDGEFWAWKLKDKYGILGITGLEGVDILGSPGPSGLIIRNPSGHQDRNNPGPPVNRFGSETCPVGYILPPSFTEQSKSTYNYKIYIKPWATIMVRVYEMEGDLDCNPGTGDASGNERINAIAAFFADPDGQSGSLGYPKDGIRSPHPQGTVKWTSSGDYFTQVVWKGLRDDGSYNPVFDSETGYTSRVIDNPQNYGCLIESFDYIKTVEKGKDSQGDNVVVYTPSFTTEGYFRESNDYDVSEFGLHTLGVNGESSDENHKEVAYFDDFYWQLWEGGQSGLFPGIQEQ